jgi:pyruvate/2-oxoglutarate dehydrogenase complex dihydrolipoamide dehydrogenase (E3) component
MNAAVEFSQGFMDALVAGDDRILGFTMIGSEAGEVMAAVQAALVPAGIAPRSGRPQRQYE